MTRAGLLLSQIGYDLHSPMRAVYRSTCPDALSPNATFTVQAMDEAMGSPVKPGYWGECWGDHWWTLDFSGLAAGDYRLVLADEGSDLLVEEPFSVAENLLWHRTFQTVGVEQFERRADWARAQVGWKDCGSNLRELCSHAASVIGLCEMAIRSPDWIAPANYRRIVDQIVHGCAYIVACQDKASALGLPDGSFVHELTQSPLLVPANAAQGGLALAMASRVIYESHPERSGDFLQRSRRTYAFVQSDESGFPPEGFSALNHGAPADFRPDGGLMTRELMMRLWFAVEMWISGGATEYQNDALALTEQIMARQIRKDQAEGGLYGHFRTFADQAFSEKANIHHHVGHDTGAIFPCPLMPLLEMIGRWYDHPDVERWKQTVHDFAYGHLLPACRTNPFNLLPSGYFIGEGVLAFCGPWHGINVSYTWLAVLACRLEAFTGDKDFRDLAVANLQWIAGLNAGLAPGMFESCITFRPELPDDRYVPFSMIEGIGNRSALGWSKIPGSIVNGFSVNPQFRLEEANTKANDGPRRFTDEDWIPHAAGWLAALACLREVQFFGDRSAPASSQRDSLDESVVAVS